MFPIETTVLFDSKIAPEPSIKSSLVTVIVTLFNYENYLSACLDSVVAQKHQRLELIVVDDCSTDASVEAARRWMERNGARFERCRLIKHLRNQGLSQARNTAFEAASAQYIFVLDADNEIFPRAIGRLLEALEDTGSGVAYSQLEFFGDENRIGYADVWDRRLFQKGNYVDAMSLVSKAAWAEVGGYTQMDLGWEDYELWCKFVEHGIDGIFVPEILCRYRVHSKSMLRTETNIKISRLEHEITSLHPWLRVGL